MIGYTEMIVTVLCPIIILWIWWRNRTSVLSSWPLVGMLRGPLRNMVCVHDLATQILRQSGGTFVFEGPWFTGMNFLMTSDPINVQYISTKNFNNYHKGSDFKEMFDPLGEGIFNVDSENWRNQRRIIHSLFKNKRFIVAVEKTMEVKILKGVLVVLENASNLEIEVDMQDIFQRFTFDCFCKLVLSIDPNSLSVEFPNLPFEKAFNEIEEVVLYRHLVPTSFWKLQRWLNIGKEKRLKKALNSFDQFIEQCIQRKIEELSDIHKNQIDDDHFDLLTSFLVEDKEEDDVTKSTKFIRDTATSLLVAGRDTIGAALAWFFWLVGTHPFVEKKIVDELKANLEPQVTNTIRVFKIEELNKLVYLHAVICETLRLYPSIPFEHKMCMEPDVLPSGHRVPSKMRVLYILYTMGRMEEIWGEDCLEFKPERWISEEGEIKHVPSSKFIAFNAGPRSCLGKDMTFLQMKIVASAILWNYCVQVVENHPVVPSNSVILSMKYGLKVRVSKR
ncbi:alkane hydroxylase MAH1-like [Mercurialis annua]|uniref:alkane hydroxylase MAH1-like n=1 Tax=Mercurialis annua TaxID=3986 RepID=UPI00215E67C5|nr:alkane hydroxylase MAH1-like [Mercurialis annua]